MLRWSTAAGAVALGYRRRPEEGVEVWAGLPPRLPGKAFQEQPHPTTGQAREQWLHLGVGRCFPMWPAAPLVTPDAALKATPGPGNAQLRASGQEASDLCSAPPTCASCCLLLVPSCAWQVTQSQGRACYQAQGCPGAQPKVAEGDHVIPALAGPWEQEQLGLGHQCTAECELESGPCHLASV